MNKFCNKLKMMYIDMQIYGLHRKYRKTFRYVILKINDKLKLTNY